MEKKENNNMLMIDFNELKIVNIEDYMTIDIVLDWNPSFLDESFKIFSRALSQKVEDELDKHLLKKPVLFRYVTRFDNDDLDLIVDNLIDAVVGYMVGGKREREARLGRPKELEQVIMLNGTIMDCINNRLDTDVFTIKVLNKQDQEFFSITELVTLL
jgi:hypothetical protein